MGWVVDHVDWVVVSGRRMAVVNVGNSSGYVE